MYETLAVIIYLSFFPKIDILLNTLFYFCLRNCEGVHKENCKGVPVCDAAVHSATCTAGLRPHSGVTNEAKNAPQNVLHG